MALFWAAIFLSILAVVAVLTVLTAVFGPPAAAAILTFLLLVFAVLMGAVVWSLFSGAPFVPVSWARAEAMVRAAGLKAGEQAVDLGSGDGRILIAAARTGARAEGWEINPYLWLISRLRARFTKTPGSVCTHLRSYWGHDFGQSDVVFLFLISFKMGTMERKLRRELPSGARVVSYAFRFPHWPGEESGGEGIYVYRQP